MNQQQEAPEGGEPEHWRSRVFAADADVLSRQAELVAIDNVIGLEAEIARLRHDLKSARARLKRTRETLAERDEQLQSILNSRTWRIGRRLAAPLPRSRQ